MHLDTAYFMLYTKLPKLDENVSVNFNKDQMTTDYERNFISDLQMINFSEY